MRLLLVTPNWLGDTIFASAMIRALRMAYRDAHIAVLCVPRVATLYREQASIDAVMVFDERGADRSLFARWRLARRLRTQHYDVAVLLRPSVSRAWLLWMAQIPRRIGAVRSGRGQFLTEQIRMDTTAHRADQYLQLLAALHIPVTGPQRCVYHVTPAEADTARAWLQMAGLAGETVVLVHPAANWEHKRWPIEHYAALIDRMQEECHVRVVVTGRPEDQPLLEALRTYMQSAVVSAIGTTTIRKMGALIAVTDLLITNDTGPLHLAAGLDHPFVALFGPTSATLTGPYRTTRGTVIQADHACPSVPCYAPQHPSYPGMAAITVDQVMHAVTAQLAKQSTGEAIHVG